MTVQIPDPGTGNGATGDNEFVLWSKVKDNFEDTTNAASREVGTSSGDVVEMTGYYGIGSFGLGGKAIPLDDSVSLNDVLKTGYYTLSSSLTGAAPAGGLTGVMWVIKRNWSSGPSVVQVVFGSTSGEAYVRTGTGGSDTSVNTWTDWNRVIIDNNNDIYASTTASGANVVVSSTGALMRSTSSERYKDILAPLALDDSAYENAMQLAPIVYRSTADADNPNYHYYSFSAETLGAYDPAFTLWRDTETVTDEETGEVTEVELEERVAEGLNLNAIVAFLHATNIKQGQLIESLESRIKALEDGE